MGVGDLSVPKKVKKAAAALYDRCRAYRSAFDRTNNDQLATEFAATFPGLEDNPEGARRLARYARVARDRLATIASPTLLEGRVTFAEVETSAPASALP
jgi:cytochrome b pre-mRNA-processing protein 3